MKEGNINDRPEPDEREQTEVRLTALALGEASDFEEAELRRAMEADPKLADYFRRIEETVGVVREVVGADVKEGAGIGPKLSLERRVAIRAKLKSGERSGLFSRLQQFEIPSGWGAWAAVFVICIGLVAAMSTPAFNRVRARFQDKAILNNLRQYASAAQQFMLDEGVTEVAYDDIVGIGKHISTLDTVADESYENLRVRQGDTSLSVGSKRGGLVSYNYGPPVRTSGVRSAHIESETLTGIGGGLAEREVSSEEVGGSDSINNVLSLSGPVREPSETIARAPSIPRSLEDSSRLSLVELDRALNSGAGQLWSDRPGPAKNGFFSEAEPIVAEESEVVAIAPLIAASNLFETAGQVSAMDGDERVSFEGVKIRRRDESLSIDSANDNFLTSDFEFKREGSDFLESNEENAEFGTFAVPADAPEKSTAESIPFEDETKKLSAFVVHEDLEQGSGRGNKRSRGKRPGRQGKLSKAEKNGRTDSQDSESEIVELQAFEIRGNRWGRRSRPKMRGKNKGRSVSAELGEAFPSSIPMDTSDGWDRAKTSVSIEDASQIGKTDREGLQDGAAGGALSGAVIGHQSGKTAEGAEIGTGSGIIIGGIYGAMTDSKERKEQEEIAQERGHQQELAKMREIEARKRAQRSEELAMTEGLRSGAEAGSIVGIGEDVTGSETAGIYRRYPVTDEERARLNEEARRRAQTTNVGEELARHGKLKKNAGAPPVDGPGKPSVHDAFMVDESNEVEVMDVFALVEDDSQPDPARASIGQRSKASDADEQYQALRRVPINKEAEKDIGREVPVRRFEPLPEIVVAEQPFSTFSLNVSDVSFRLAAASLAQGMMPSPAEIRSEEFLNAQNYHDPVPTWGLPLSFHWERARSPFHHNREFLRFAVQTASEGRERTRPLSLVLLIDNSGSMERADRRSIVQAAVTVLADALRKGDRISLVAFDRTPRLVVDQVSSEFRSNVAGAVDGLQASGATHLEGGLDLAYEVARTQFQANAGNRVVLMTDGAANLGEVLPDNLRSKVVSNRKLGIALDCFGIGADGLNDAMLEALSRNGDGRYGFLNSVEDVDEGFSQKLAGSLRTAASDVKVQVEFNPDRVESYRQIGYRRHQLNREDFRDDSVDAAEIGSAESGNALYLVARKQNGVGPVATVRVRFRDPASREVREHSWNIPARREAPALREAHPSLRLAVSATMFGEWLAESPYAEGITPRLILENLNGVIEAFPLDAGPVRLREMVEQAAAISGK